MIYQIIIILFLLSTSHSLINKNINSMPNLLQKPKNMINYLTSFKDYTIISIGYKNFDLEKILNEKENKIYYVNLENLLEYDNILEYLEKEYKKYNEKLIEDYTEDYAKKLWLFYKGNYIGTEKDIDKLV